MSKPATRAASWAWPGSTLSTLRYASSARFISPFSSNAIPSTKCASASALRAPPVRRTRSGAGLESSESSWRPVCFAWFERGVFVVRSASAFAVARKMSAKMIPQQGKTSHFERSLMINLIFFRDVRQTDCLWAAVAPATWRARPRDRELSLCTLHGPREASFKQRLFWRDAKANRRHACTPQIEIRRSTLGVERWTFSGHRTVTDYTLYRSRFLCRCARIRLRRLCLAIFAFRLFLREPIQFSESQVAIQPSNPLHCNCNRWDIALRCPGGADLVSRWGVGFFSVHGRLAPILIRIGN